MADSLTKLIPEAIEFCRDEYKRRWDESFTYHNFEHTKDVFGNALEIGQTERLSNLDLDLVQLAALFHDHGHLDGQTDHESRSAEIADAFLKDRAVKPEHIEQVKTAIAATKVPQQPHNEVSNVLCDADLKYLATDDFFAKAELLRQEWWSTGRAQMEPAVFFKYSLDFLHTHFYHTRFGKEVLTPGKEKNLAILEHMLRNGRF